MRKFFMILLLIFCLLSPTWAEDTEEDIKPPVLSLNIILKDAIAFSGFGLELLLGHLGLGGTFTFFFFGSDDVFGTGETAYFYIYEPGVFVHFYFFEPEASLYILGDVSFAMFALGTDDATFDSGDYNSGLLSLNGGIGFNAFFGKNNKIHFSVELGARYMQWIIKGEEEPIPLCFPVIPHFQLQFGMGLF